MTGEHRARAVILSHGRSGRVNSREGWVECACGVRLPCELDSDGYSANDDEDTIRATHAVDMLVAAGLLVP